LPGLLFHPEDGDDTFLQNIGSLQITWGYNPEDYILIVIALFKQTTASSNNSDLYLGDA
jgi:hypothetical protein